MLMSLSALWIQCSGLRTWKKFLDVRNSEERRVLQTLTLKRAQKRHPLPRPWKKLSLMREVPTSLRNPSHAVLCGQGMLVEVVIFERDADFNRNGSILVWQRPCGSKSRSQVVWVWWPLKRAEPCGNRNGSNYRILFYFFDIVNDHEFMAKKRWGAHWSPTVIQIIKKTCISWTENNF